MAKPIKSDTYVVVPGRFSYVHVFEKFSNIKGQDPKYSLMLIIPKSDKATLAKLKKAIEAAKKQGVSSKWGGKLPKNLNIPLHDGDEDFPDVKDFENTYYLNASTTRKPSVVDNHLNEILDEDQVYSGCYGRISINMFPYDAAGNRGVSAGLNNVQWLRKGERLDGGRTANDDFDEVEDSFEDEEEEFDELDMLG